MDNETIAMAFGKNVRGFREKKGYSQEKLAELCGLHRTYVGGIERGTRNPSLINIAKIARSLGVRAADLLRGIK